MPTASVIVPARNAAGTIARTLEALGKQDFTDGFEVIVVDNGSDDDTPAVAAAALEEARVIRNEPGRVGSARNRGVEEASSESLAFLDADCVPSKGWLREGVAALESADLVQGAVAPDPDATRAPFDRTVSVMRESGLYETANLFVRRTLFDAIDGFSELVETDISAPFGEDVWFGWRARRHGARTAFCRAALAHHAVFPRSARAYAEERRRCMYFPDLALHIPELRGAFFWKGWFLTPRTAAFDAALIGAATALTTRSRLPWVLAAPYARLALKESSGWRRRAPRSLAGNVWADAVTFVALVKGSARTGALVL